MADKKVIQLEDRIPKLKEQRRQKTNRRMIFYLTVFFALIMAVVYFESPLSNVRTITIKGNQYLSKSEIENQSGVTTKSKIWDIDEKQVANRLKELPMVKSAVINSHFPSSVSINVVEYSRVAYITKGDHYFPVLSSGSVMNEVSGNKLPFQAPIITGVKQGKELTRLTKQILKLEPAIKNEISEIHAVNGDSTKLQLYMNDGNLVLVTENLLANKMNEFYPSINAEQKEKGIIDLTVGAVWRPFVDSKKGNDKDEKR